MSNYSFHLGDVVRQIRWTHGNRQCLPGLGPTRLPEETGRHAERLRVDPLHLPVAGRIGDRIGAPDDSPGKDVCVFTLRRRPEASADVLSVSGARVERMWRPGRRYFSSWKFDHTDFFAPTFYYKPRICKKNSQTQNWNLYPSWTHLSNSSHSFSFFQIATKKSNFAIFSVRPSSVFNLTPSLKSN